MEKENALKVQEGIQDFVSHQLSNLPKDKIDGIIDENIGIFYGNVDHRFFVDLPAQVSIKPYNILINLKKLLKSLLELYISFGRVDDFEGGIRVIFLTIARLLEASVINLSREKCKIIELVFYHNGAIDEEELRQQISLIEDAELQNSIQNHYFDIITELSRMKIVEIINGKIILKEQVLFNSNGKI